MRRTENLAKPRRGRPRKDWSLAQPGTISVGQSFGQQLQAYLEAFRITSSDLARSVDVDPATLSSWLSGRKTPTLDSIIKVSRALDELVEHNPAAIQQGLRLDVILVTLMRRGGYAVPDGPRDICWKWARGDTTRPDGTGAGLTIGWTPCAPLAAESQNEKIALDIAAVCARLMGLPARFRPVVASEGRPDWEALVSRLVAREIDLIAPILARSPHNAPQGVRFSEPIDLFLYHLLLVNRRVVQERMPSVLNGNKFSEQHLRQISFLTVGSGVSTQIFAPDPYDQVEAQSVATLEAGLETVLSASKPERVPALVVDAPTAIRLTANKRELVRLDPPITRDIALPLCFGIREGEDRLLAEINLAISAMRDSGMMARFLESRGEYLKGFLWRQPRSIPKKVPGSDETAWNEGVGSECDTI